MSRTTIALLAVLLFLAPAASARPADVMPERITDHSAPKVDEIAIARAQEESYSTKVNPDAGGLVLEEESTSGSGNQGIAPRTDSKTRALAQERAYSTYGGAPPIEREPAQASGDGDDSAPWLLIGAGFAGIAALFGLAVLLVARPRRPRVAT